MFFPSCHAQGLKIKKQRSTGDLEKRVNSGGSMRSTASSASWVSTESSHSGSGIIAGSVNDESNASFVVEVSSQATKAPDVL
jgi:hypothetical protein